MKNLLYILLFVPLAGFGQENLSLHDNLVAWYPFNGNVNDESDNSNNGIVYGATLTADRCGNSDAAYSFDGVGDYIQLTDISLPSSFSVSVWAYNNVAYFNKQAIINKWGDWRIAGEDGIGEPCLTSGGIQFGMVNTSNTYFGSCQPTSSIGSWKHIVGVFDAVENTIDLYVDGVLVNTSAFSGSRNYNPDQILLGSKNTFEPSGFWDGVIDDVRIYSDVLSDSEIWALFFESSCLSQEQYLIDSLQTELINQNEEATTSISSLQQALDTWNTTIDLSAGWNMFGYGCPEPGDLVAVLSNHIDLDLILIVKDNVGRAYLPEFGFNGIGDFTPGFGYQIKVTEAIEGFSSCDWYVNDIPEDNIVSLQEENAFLQAELDSIYGCTSSWACNYDETALVDDGSCYNNDLGCGCDVPGPEDGYDCDGNIYWINGCMDEESCNYNAESNLEDGSCVYAEEDYDCNGLCIDEFSCIYGLGTEECIYPEQGYTCEGTEILHQVGDYIEGGIVFFIDALTGAGLVADMEDVEGIYEWGCYGTGISGADEQAIGTGYQNTMDIVAGCSETPIAASEALAYEAGGYTDWYLPSKDELYEMYYTLRYGGLVGDIGGFENNWYWSSSENYHDLAWTVSFYDGQLNSQHKFNAYGVRVIRAFGYTQGCMDETACNFNPEANMSDGSCEYPELGYNCDGNELELYIGQFAYGGIVFYVDESGDHGLVSAFEDLTEGASDPNGWGVNGYEWGCFQSLVSGADGTPIGTGFQNTMDIVNQGCATENGGVIAAQAALDYESEGYSDWYLPSKHELYEMYKTIGNGGSQGDIGGFGASWYWSSSEGNNVRAWYVGFSDGNTGSHGDGLKSNTSRVRVIRAF